MPFDIIPDGKPIEEPEEAAAAEYPKMPATAGQVLGEEAASTFRQVSSVAAQGAYQGSGLLPQVLYGLGRNADAIDPMTAGQEAMPPPGSLPSPMVPPDEFNKKYAPLGNDGKLVSLGDKPMPDAIAKLIGEAKTEEIERGNVLGRYQNAHGWPTNFAVSAAGFMLDPLRAATAFVPGIGEEAILARLGVGALARTGARVIAGGAAGALAMAPVAALEYGLGQYEMSDYSLRDAFRDVAFGAAGNAIIHAGITGPMGDLLRYRRGEIQPGALNAPEWRAAADVVSADAQTQHTAVSTAVAELADGRPIDVEPIFSPPLRRPEPIEGFEFEDPNQIPSGSDFRTGTRATLAEMEARRSAETTPAPPTWDTLSPSDFENGKTLRLYRGETAGGQPIAPGAPGTGGWFTTDPAKAARYGDVSYIDVTRDELGAFARGHGGADEFVTTDAAITGRSRPLGPVAETPPITPAALAASQAELHRDGFSPGVPNGELRQISTEIYEPPPGEAMNTFRTEVDINGQRTIIEGPTRAPQEPAGAPAAPPAAEPVPAAGVQEAPAPRPAGSPPEQALGGVPSPPPRLASFLKREGGLRDETFSRRIPTARGRADAAANPSDLRSIGAGDMPGLIKARTGMSLDDAALKAWEAGYLPEAGTERATINHLLDALADDLRGVVRYSEKDLDAARAHESALSRNAEVDRLANETGIEAKGKTRDQFFDEVRDHLSLEEAARRAESLAAAHETNLAAAERRAQEWAAQRGEAWQPDYDIGRPRTLEELEDAYRQEEATRWTTARTSRDGGPEPATGVAGTIQTGGGSGERGVGAGRLTGPASELTDQGEQLILPGGERSAVQAAQAREAAGRGLLRSTTEQREAGGLFESPKTNEPGLFDAELADAQAQLQRISADLLPEERATIADAQAATAEAERRAQAIAEAAFCLKDTGI